MKGLTGKILRVDLSRKSISTIDSSRYEEWIGGHGMASAIFWDLRARDLPFSAFDPKNVIFLMPGLFCGTFVPGASRPEVLGLGPEPWPVEWWTRSNFGGRFSTMLKMAGWDGIVIEGASDKPVWINIVDDDVTIEDATGLWGLDTYETQKQIWKEVSGHADFGGWIELKNGKWTTQRPAVVCIGPIGEVMCRDACLVHDAGHGAGQGGFGAVFGAKKLKAVSVIGTKEVEVADPKALFETRTWCMENYRGDIETRPTMKEKGFAEGWAHYQFWSTDRVVLNEPDSRPYGCTSCIRGCKVRNKSGLGNESNCVDVVFAFYLAPPATGEVAPVYLAEYSRKQLMCIDIPQKMGVNVYPFVRILGQPPYLKMLHDQGVMGPGKEINADLPWDLYGTIDFLDELFRKIIAGEDIGLELREGVFRFLLKYRENDLRKGIVQFPYWGFAEHLYDVRAEASWGLATIVDSRDICHHNFNAFIMHYPEYGIMRGNPMPLSAKEIAEIFAKKMIPYTGDPLMLDHSDEGIYSEHMAKLVAWDRHYSLFWKDSCGLCDWSWPDIVNPYAPNNEGMTPEAEERFFKAVTGVDLSFADGVEIGRKIWNLDNAIWVLQGRHRDMVQFMDYIYEVPYEGLMGSGMYYLPVYENGKWSWKNVAGRKLDKVKFEEWKTKYYALEGWDPNTGWPKRSTLEALGLKHVADLLEAKGKLGKG